MFWLGSCTVDLPREGKMPSLYVPNSPLAILPQTLKELAVYACEGSDIWHARLREFLDVFYTTPTKDKFATLKDEPPLAANAYFDAYMGATAEYLAYEYKIEIPRWAFAKERFLRKPVFPCGLDGMKTYLLCSTPSSFERRMIFTGEQPLYRPLRDYRSSFVTYEEGQNYGPN
jgi:hypothetical protein